ncbi:glycosyltransferase [Knoellia sp. CPCC 206453]|uniref:glycosyltransferase n=1 Tax=Knoellia pratensis TaxID=3404796 RepID=UPI00361B9067
MSPEVDRVSVVIPVYNVVDYLEQCLDSVVAQTHEFLDVILIDDGSTDGSGPLCDNLAARDPRFRVIHQANHGLSHARNVGIAAATGTFVTFLDSDDWWDPTFVATLVRAIDARPEAGAAMCSFIRVPGKAYDPGIERTRLLTPAEAITEFAGAYHSLFVISCAKLFRRDLLPPDLFPVGRLAEDAFTTHRLLMKAPVVQVPQPLYLYRQRPHSITSQTFTVARQLDEVEGSERQVQDFADAGLLRAAGWSADQAFRKRARLIAAMKSMRTPGAEEQYAALARQSRSSRVMPRHPVFRVLATLAGLSPRLAVAVFGAFASASLRTRATSRSTQRIALTFDDGPASDTPALVQFLLDQSAQATFFLRGDRSEECPDVVRLLHASPGMEIGTHSHTHPDLHLLHADDIRAELRRSNEVIASITGTVPAVFRPPMGHRNRLIDSIAGELGQSVILWSVNSMDFKDPASATTKVLADAQDGDIVLLHDTSTQTMATISSLVPALRSRGFEFVTVSALLDRVSPGTVYTGANSRRIRLRRWVHLQRLRIARRTRLLRARS